MIVSQGLIQVTTRHATVTMRKVVPLQRLQIRSENNIHSNWKLELEDEQPIQDSTLTIGNEETTESPTASILSAVKSEELQVTKCSHKDVVEKFTYELWNVGKIQYKWYRSSSSHLEPAQCVKLFEDIKLLPYFQIPKNDGTNRL